jgi:cytochrome P450
MGQASSAGSDLPSFPFAAAAPWLPPAEYAQRRESCPMGRVRLPSGDTAVLLVTYRDSAAAVADTRLSHNLTAPGSPRMTAGPSPFDDPNVLINMDGEEHLRIRRIVASAFTPRRVERWKPVIRATAQELLDTVERGEQPADIIFGFCLPLPIRVMCRLLGVPEDDMARFRDWALAFTAGARMTAQRRQELTDELGRYAAELIARKRAEPGQDLIDELIAARDGSDRLGEVELLYLIITLIAAGNEATTNALSRFLLTLLRDDGRLWDQLVGRPEAVAGAVDELLRHTVLGNIGLLRMATEDVQLPSGTVAAGQAVLIMFQSAQRDAAVYEHPDEVVFGRAAPPALAFGGGPHYCLGAHLAKAQLTIGLGLLLERIPKLRLAVAPERLEFTDGELFSSLHALPVTW